MPLDRYVPVKAVFVARTRDAILVDVDMVNITGDHKWIPLSLIHAADERRLNNAVATDIVEFRLMAWKASQIGLA